MKETLYRKNKIRLQKQAILDFCNQMICQIEARDYQTYKTNMINMPITLPREVAQVILGTNLPKYFAKDECIGTVLGRKLCIY